MLVIILEDPMADKLSKIKFRERIHEIFHVSFHFFKVQKSRYFDYKNILYSMPPRLPKIRATQDKKPITKPIALDLGSFR